MKDTLFDLINSLTRSEKRYFKLFASRHTIGEENNYVTLFNYIEKQSNYSEDSIFQKFSGENFLNNFSITKKRLYNNILSALDSFHLGNSEEAQLLRQIHAAEILIGKSLHEQAKKIILSVEKQAIKREYSLIIQKIFRLKNNYYREFGMDQNELKNLHVNYSKLEDLQSNELVYLQLSKALSMLKIDPEHFAELPSCQLICTTENQLLFNHIELLKATKQSHFSNAEIYYNINKQLFLEHLDLTINYFGLQMEMYRNGFNNALAQGKLNDATSILSEITLAEGGNEHHRANCVMHREISEIDLAIYELNYDRLAQLVVANKQLNSTNQGNTLVHVQNELILKIAIAHLFLNKNNEGLLIINHYLQHNDQDYDAEMTSIALVLDCVFHFELKHHDYLKYAVKNTTRYLKSRNQYNNVNKSVLSLLLKLPNTNKIDQEELYQEYYNKLANLKDAHPLLVINFNRYLTHKLKQLHHSEAQKIN
ncbi:MAG: hypothetical protein V4638_02295 [Bacteroidota bacterium]